MEKGRSYCWICGKRVAASHNSRDSKRSIVSLDLWEDGDSDGDGDGDQDEDEDEDEEGTL